MKKNDKKIKQKLKGRKPGQRFVFSRQSLIASENITVLPGTKEDEDVEDIAKEDVKDIAKEDHKDSSKGRKSGWYLVISHSLYLLHQ
jgi:hypothetical protein